MQGITNFCISGDVANPDNIIFENVRPYIFVKIDEDTTSFFERVKNDLDIIEANPIGKRLIEKIEKSAHVIIIKSAEYCFCNPVDPMDTCCLGKGTASVIGYSLLDYATPISYQCKPIETPPFVHLVHELMHGLHNSRGKTATTNHCDRLVWTDDEEYHVIEGFPSKKGGRTKPKISENAFRVAQGLQRRFSHRSFEFLQKYSFIFSRVKLLAALYLKNRPQFEPGPIINITDKDIQPLGGTIIYWRVLFKNDSVLSPVFGYLPRFYLSENFPFMDNNYNIKLLPKEFEFRNLFPELADKVLEIDPFVGIYKTSQTDAKM